MDFDRDWTQFALDAEVDTHGTARIAEYHNRTRRLVARLRDEVHDLNESIDGARAALLRRERAIEAAERVVMDAAARRPSSVLIADIEGAKISRVTLLEDQLGNPGGMNRRIDLQVIRAHVLPDGTVALEVAR